MKHFKKIMIVGCALLLSMSYTIGCSRNNIHNTSAKGAQTAQGQTQQTQEQQTQISTQEQQQDSENTASIPDEFKGENTITRGTGYYNCDFDADRSYINSHGIDIKVGDNLYMTQINDWFKNFDDYNGKTVEIEGYYLDFAPYSFVGRHGPTCPYCTGGYVDFEFVTDQDISELKDTQTWIKVVGILKKGYDVKVAGDFYYIEATSIQTMDKVGKDTIKD